MTKTPTKAELMEQIEDYQTRLRTAQNQLAISNEERRRDALEIGRLQSDARLTQNTMRKIRHTCLSMLRVKHDVGEHRDIQYVHGHEVDDANDEIRLLRYIAELSNNDVPF